MKGSKIKKDKNQTLTQERDLLKLTLKHYVDENENLKTQLGDTIITMKASKDLLREYVEKITSKDQVVEKMANTIDHLQSRLTSLEEYIKQNTNGDKSYRSVTPKRTKTKFPKNLDVSNIFYEPPILNPFHGVESKRKESSKQSAEELKIKRKNDELRKEFFMMQSKCIEQINSIKSEVHTLLCENRGDKKIKDENVEIPLEFGIFHHPPQIKKSNLGDLTNENSFKIFLNILQTNRMENSNENMSIIIFVDDKLNIWELLRRPDLNFDSIIQQKDVFSYKELFKNAVQFNEFRTINIESTQTSSVGESDLDISRVSDFNITNFIKESFNNI